MEACGELYSGLNLGSLPNLSQLFDYVSVDENSQAGSSVLPDQDHSTPFAQSFTVDNQFGVIVTAVDLFFQTVPTANDDVPVTVEIVTVDAGKPTEEAVPGTTVSLDRATIASNISNDASTPVTFTFDEPAYLDPGQEYAIAIKTASPEYKIWIAKSGEFQIGSNERIVSTQAANGRLYSPQTGLAGNSKELDLAFNLKRAVFDTNASLVLRNAVLPYNLLDNNPIVLEDQAVVAKVKHDCHGLASGEFVTISGVENVNLGGSGVAVGDLNGTHQVISADYSGFTFTVPQISGTREIGGDEVLSGRNLMFTTANPQIESVVPNKCSVDMTARFTKGQSIGNLMGETKFDKEPNYSRIVPDQNIEFSEPRMIADRDEETYDGSGNTRPYNNQSIYANNGSSGFSLDVKVDLKSASDFVGPIVDLQRCSMTLVQNCIDDADTDGSQYLGGADETSPNGSGGPSKHVTAPIKTPEPSTALDFIVDANVPNVSDLKFYYRGCMTGQNLLDVNWSPISPVKPIVKDDNPQSFNQIKLQKDSIPKFTESQVKVVMKSKSMAKVPQISRIQARTFLR